MRELSDKIIEYHQKWGNECMHRDELLMRAPVLNDSMELASRIPPEICKLEVKAR